jgi:hypothetical protein
MRGTFDFTSQLHPSTSVSSTWNIISLQSALSNERLVYTKSTFWKSSVVSSTPNARFFKMMTSRLHQTHTLGSGSTVWRKPGCWFLGKQWEMQYVNLRPVYVEHTLSKNGTFHRASRLHQMHIRKIEYRVAYGKCYLFWKSDVSSTRNAYFGGRADPNAAELGWATFLSGRANK